MKKYTIGLMTMLSVIALSGCTGPDMNSKTTQGALIGTVGGAAVGGIVNGGKGAAVGALLGGVTGAAIGNNEEKKDYYRYQ